MKQTLFIRLIAPTISLLLLAGATANAQLPAGSAGGMSATLARFFGAHKAFTAQADVQVLDRARKEVLRMPMSFANLDGKIRVEIDITQVKSKDLTPKVVAGLKQAGAGKIISVIRPDKKESYVMYPGTQSYTVMEMPKAEADAVGKALKLEKTALGKETIDGHPCVKNRVVVKDGQNVVIEATTWNATDLKDFPVQIETKDGGNVSIMRFKKIQFTKPDAKKFEPPARYKLAK
jgi:hypothetical protein